MEIKSIQQEKNYHNSCSLLEGPTAASEETCLKCGFKCIEGGV